MRAVACAAVKLVADEPMTIAMASMVVVVPAVTKTRMLASVAFVAERSNMTCRWQ